jgi:hypothetical protein
MAIWKILGLLGNLVTIWYILCWFGTFFRFWYLATLSWIAVEERVCSLVFCLPFFFLSFFSESNNFQCIKTLMALKVHFQVRPNGFEALKMGKAKNWLWMLKHKPWAINCCHSNSGCLVSRVTGCVRERIAQNVAQPTFCQNHCTNLNTGKNKPKNVG